MSNGEAGARDGRPITLNGTELKLVIRDAGDGITGDRGDWAGARLTTRAR